jgi:Flp pilus assembly protein TadD
MARITVVVLIVLLVCGCVHHTVDNFGGSRQKPTTPPPSVRSILQQQARNNPISPVSDSHIQSLQNRLKANPVDAVAHLELASVYESYRLFAEALAQYTTTSVLSRSEKVMLGIARCSLALGRGPVGIPILEQFLRESSSPLVWNALAQLYSATGDLAKAENALSQAVAVDSQSDQWHNNLGYNLLLQNKVESAEAELRNALRLNSKSATAHNNLGMLLARRGDLNGALQQFEVTADAATAHNNLAVILMEMGKYEQSREYLTKALALRRYYGPALSNFRLVQERIRQQTEPQKVGISR